MQQVLKPVSGLGQVKNISAGLGFGPLRLVFVQPLSSPFQTKLNSQKEMLRFVDQDENL